MHHLDLTTWSLWRSSLAQSRRCDMHFIPSFRDIYIEFSRAEVDCACFPWRLLRHFWYAQRTLCQLTRIPQAGEIYICLICLDAGKNSSHWGCHMPFSFNVTQFSVFRVEDVDYSFLKCVFIIFLYVFLYGVHFVNCSIIYIHKKQ